MKKPISKDHGQRFQSALGMDISILEPLVEGLVTGQAATADVAKGLAKLGYPHVTDPTEQLRVALSLLECHDVDSTPMPTKKRSRGRLQEQEGEV